MSLAYVLDENQRGPLWRAIQTQNALGTYPLDAVRVGDGGGLPLGSPDPELILWAEQHARIIVSFDRTNLPLDLANHLNAGHHSPGLFLIRRSAHIQEIMNFLVIAAYASEAYEWRDRIEYIG